YLEPAGLKITPFAGETVHCTVTNEAQLGQITIIKEVNWEAAGTVDPADLPDVLFDFDGNVPDFDLGHGDSVTLELLSAVTYNIVEDVPANWALTNVSCDGDVVYTDDGVQIELAQFDDITCTFTNEPSCTNPAADLVGQLSSDGTTGLVTNQSTALCTWEVGMASYEKYDDDIDNQVLFDYVDGVAVAPGETVELSVELPECAVQVDLFHGPALLSLDGQRYGSRLLRARHLPGSGYCERVAGLNTVSGYVVASGQGLPGLTVTLVSNEADGAILQTVTNIDGFYGFEGVAFGSYQVILSGEGLNGLNIPTVTAVAVSADGPATANFEALMTPTAVTVSAIGTAGQGHSGLLAMVVMFLLAAVTVLFWRRVAQYS
ncbi:MAG: carboxypeptidase regulatory-like domain-containing protein, partial [Anaerolineales bacterium]|nr:carboxypeptidase regulatory-like domain-containing protein [Anaerolineales bacterium]